MKTKYTLGMLEISGKILETIDSQEDLPGGDFQGAIEAQVMKAFLMGREQILEQLKEEQDEYVWGHLIKL